MNKTNIALLLLTIIAALLTLLACKSTQAAEPQPTSSPTAPSATPTPAVTPSLAPAVPVFPPGPTPSPATDSAAIATATPVPTPTAVPTQAPGEVPVAAEATTEQFCLEKMNEWLKEDYLPTSHEAIKVRGSQVFWEVNEDSFGCTVFPPVTVNGMTGWIIFGALPNPLEKYLDKKGLISFLRVGLIDNFVDCAPNDKEICRVGAFLVRFTNLETPLKDSYLYTNPYKNPDEDKEAIKVEKMVSVFKLCYSPAGYKEGLCRPERK